MEEVGQSTPEDSNKTDLLEVSQVFIRQLKESKDREIRLQEKIRLLEKQQGIQNGTAVPNQQQHNGVQELHQQIVELTLQFHQMKSISDEKVQRLSNEVAKLKTEAKDKDAKIKDMTDRENAHSIDGVREEKDVLQQQLNQANARLERMRVASEARDQQLANRDNRERDRLNTVAQELKAQLEKANEEIEDLKKDLDENEYRLANTQKSLSEAEERIRQTSTADVERKLDEYEKCRVKLRRLQRENDGLKTANEDAWRQVDNLRKMNEDMNASAALTISEKESAVERIAEISIELQTERSEKNELQTRIRRLEGDNKKLKETVELFGDGREAAASHFQQERSSYEARIVELQLSVSRVREDARREQRKLEYEIFALKEHGRQVEKSSSTDTPALESARKKMESLEAKLLMTRTLLNEKNQKIGQLTDDLRQAKMASRGSDNMSSSTAMGTSAVGERHPNGSSRGSGEWWWPRWGTRDTENKSEQQPR